MPHREDLVLAFYKKASRLPLPARASQTMRPGTQTSKGNSLPLYSLVSGSTHMHWEGPSQWSQIINHLKWYTRRALQAPPADYRECSFSFTLWCDHQIQTREGNTAHWCTEQRPLTSFWGNQTGYESWLHSLQQDLDCQTLRYYKGRPHSWHCLLAISAGMATPKEAYSVNGQGILGLQRPALHRWRTAVDGS